MSRHWRPHSTRWLSPEDYRALSPKERRRLFAMRAGQKRERQTLVHLAGRSEGVWGHAASLGLTIIGAVLVGVAFAAIRYGNFDIPSLTRWAPASTPVRADFTYCYAGGGTNCVVDGDTFYLNGEKVRIAGIDAPETHPSRCADEARLGNAATERLHALLNSGAVTMTSIDRNRDVYGRLLRNLAVDGEDVGEAMISAGVAREYGSGRRSWC